MDDGDVRSIQRLIAEGFPDPPEIPSLPSVATKEQRQDRHDQEAAQFFDRLAHKAVNLNEKRSRDLMKHYLVEHLLHGKPLPIAARTWLIYVLENLDDLPHASSHEKKRPTDSYGRLNNMMRLANFIANKNKGVVPEKLTSILCDQAANSLGMSVGTVKNLFHSEEFTELTKNLFMSGLIKYRI